MHPRRLAAAAAAAALRAPSGSPRPAARRRALPLALLLLAPACASATQRVLSRQLDEPLDWLALLQTRQGPAGVESPEGSVEATPSVADTARAGRGVLPVSSSEARQPAAQLQLAAAGRAKGRAGSASRASKPISAGWFGDFSQAESTFSEDGADAYLDQDPARIVEFGWDKGYKVPHLVEAVTPEWFDESPSAGKQAAWQSHYPAVSGSVAGNRDVRSNTWRNTPEGWVQNYNPAPLGDYDTPRVPGEFFDSDVIQFDGYGRRSLPYPGSQRRFLDSTGGAWTQRTAKANISCATLGCTANTTLEVLNTTTEEAEHCRIGIAVHATDYDDDWSKEYIKFWKVNGFMLKSHCDPMAKGCNNTAARFLYPCVNDFPAGNLVAAGKGVLFVEGSINRMVDDCPYEGNLLSGEVQVTCMVRPKPNSTAFDAEDEVDISPANMSAIEVSEWMRCSKPGCAAHKSLYLNPQLALLGGQCELNITVAQTDFDSPYEDVEYISLEGAGNLTTNASLGKNPCTMRDEGKNVTEEDRWYVVVTNYNVTAELLAPPQGMLRFQGKISQQVDECGHDGALLDAHIVVRCSPPA